MRPRLCKACRQAARRGPQPPEVFRCRGCQGPFCKHYGGLRRTEKDGSVTVLCDACKTKRVKPTGIRPLRLGGWRS
jgi:hypothetical protein